MIPETPSRVTIGKSTARDRPRAQFVPGSPNRPITHGATSPKTARQCRQAEKHQPEEARSHAPRALTLTPLQQVAEDGDERRRERRVGEKRADEVRHLERDGEGVDPSGGAEVVGRHHLADEAEDAREPLSRARRSASTVPAACAALRGITGSSIGRTAVSVEAFRQSSNRTGSQAGLPCLRRRLVPCLQPRVALGLAGGVVHRASIRRASATLAAPPSAGVFSRMPNIRQQKKRVRISSRRRLENLHYRSTIKTLTKRLSTAVSDGDTSAIADRAPQPGATDRPGGGPAALCTGTQAATGRNPQVARLGFQAARRLTRCGSTPRERGEFDERPLELQLRPPTRKAALERMVEIGQPYERAVELGPGLEVPHLCVELAAAGYGFIPSRVAASPALSPCSSSRWAARAFRTCSVRPPTSLGSVRDTGSPVRSSIRSAARRTPPTSRAPHASVRAHGGDSARGVTRASTSAEVTTSPPAHVASLSTSPASSCRSLPTSSVGGTGQASGWAGVPCTVNCSAIRCGSCAPSRPRGGRCRAPRRPSPAARPSSSRPRRARASSPEQATRDRRRAPSRRVGSTSRRLR